MKTLRNKAVLIVLVGLLAVSGAFAQSTKADEGVAILNALSMSFRSVAEKVTPSVVEINVVEVVQQPTQVFPFFFDRRQQQQTPQTQEFTRQGLGSGVIVKKDGSKAYVLTNAHVVGDAKEINISLADGRKFDATLVGSDDRKDIALVTFTTKEDVPVAELGDSDQMFVGDWVLAVGNPLGFESSVTAGIVSAVGRKTSGLISSGSLSGFTDYIQTDAAINQGNSGGALVNLRGQVIGINSWIASTSGGSIGLGFAIPINNAKKAIDDFITKGRVEYGWLGITISEPTAAVMDDMKIKDRTGSFVYSVFQGGPADKAGIRPGDYITAVNGTAVKDTNQLLTIVGNISPGSTARFELVRSGKKMDVQVKVTARDTEKAIADQAKLVWPGFTVVKVTDAIRDQLKLSRNAGDVIISTVDDGGPASIAGLRTGDIVLTVNGKSVKNIADFYDSLNANSSNDEVLFTLYRQGNRLTVGLSK